MKEKQGSPAAVGAHVGWQVVNTENMLTSILCVSAEMEKPLCGSAIHNHLKFTAGTRPTT